MRVCSVIIAGGIGERLWPLSRQNLPKQMLCLCEKEPLIEAAIKRIEPLSGRDKILIFTSHSLKPHLERALPYLPRENIIGEPCRRNTGPAVGLAAYWIEKNFGEGVMAILPSDHFIKEADKFRKVIERGLHAAWENDALVTVGITPDRPETGYGYIERGEEVKEGVWKVARFIEKPPLKKAKEFVASSSFLWNSGMLLGKTSTILRNIKLYLPTVFQGLEEVFQGKISLQEVYPTFPDISIDYGVLEKSKDVLMVEGNFFWDDVGNWSAMERILPKDKEGNAKQGLSLNLDSHDLIIWGQKDKLVATLGVKDLIIVDTPDALLVMEKSLAQEVKKILARLREKKEKFEKYL
ncbi:MAG: mannose-1-phosphate guanylyltransferase [Caldiserica bacterium]|nr:mannose-1-phosphate guanylyltransferase [Caldisericota bacterium]